MEGRQRHGHCHYKGPGVGIIGTAIMEAPAVHEYEEVEEQGGGLTLGQDKMENRHSGFTSAKEVKRRVGCAPQGQDMRSQPFKVCFEMEQTVAHRRHGEEEEELLISHTISFLFCHRVLVVSVALTG
ncbi:hypothetical protein B0H14DRAFT_2612100 [Mycena olivaceomarginata]|nr:hypothetical protein B0H14DRAFT_2612100 [Mycena olivaceomarginata]